MVNENASKNFIKVLKGSAVSVIITLILLLIFSVLLTYTNIKESAIPTVIIAITREFDSCLTLNFFKALIMLIFFVKFRIFSCVPLRVVV